jgi:parallel beta-helix repeat protein
LIRKGLAVVIILLFIGTAIIPSKGQKVETLSLLMPRGNTFYVGGNGPGNYSTIQSAIDNASDEDTIFIYNGVYYENILINKSISLIGENKYTTIIDGGRQSQISVVKIMTSPFHIGNLTIQNEDWDGIEAGYLGMQYTLSNSTICNCRILKTHIGVLFWNSSNMLVSNCTIFDNLEGVVLVESKYCRIEHCVLSNRQRCVSLNKGAQNNTVVECEMSGNASEQYGYGIDSFGDYNTISHCIISNEGDGICIAWSNHTRIDNCSIYNNPARGISISKGNNNVIENCNIHFNGNDTSAIFYGIQVGEGAYNLITKCNISNNSQGGIRFLWRCHQNTITKSIIEHNGYITNGEGVRCDSPNSVYLNNFIDNYIQAYDTDSNSNWDDGTLGNYWNDYSGKDLNNDAIGDTSYPLYKDSNEDTHPLLYPYNPYGPSVAIITPTDANHLYLYLRNIKLIPLSKTVIIGNIIIKVKAVCYGYTSDITKIEFYVDGILRHIDNRAPYHWRWQVSSPLHHSHTLKIIAYDSFGNIGQDEIDLIKFG